MGGIARPGGKGHHPRVAATTPPKRNTAGALDARSPADSILCSADFSRPFFRTMHGLVPVLHSSNLERCPRRDVSRHLFYCDVQ